MSEITDVMKCACANLPSMKYLQVCVDDMKVERCEGVYTHWLLSNMFGPEEVKAYGSEIIFLDSSKSTEFIDKFNSSISKYSKSESCSSMLDMRDMAKFINDGGQIKTTFSYELTNKNQILQSVFIAYQVFDLCESNVFICSTDPSNYTDKLTYTAFFESVQDMMIFKAMILKLQELTKEYMFRPEYVLIEPEKGIVRFKSLSEVQTFVKSLRMNRFGHVSITNSSGANVSIGTTSLSIAKTIDGSFIYVRSDDE